MKSNALEFEHDFGSEGEPLDASVYSVNQVHSSDVFLVEPEAEKSVIKDKKGDGLVSTRQTVAVQTGDCLPLLFGGVLSNGAPIVAAVHAGWRGLHAGIVEKAAKLLIEQGALNLTAVIGPAIGPCCFEVDRATFEVFSRRELNQPFLFNRQPQTKRGYRELQAKPTENDLWIDLAGIAKMQLENCGLRPERIELLPICTYCGGRSLASYRRATHERSKAGRQWSWISIQRRSDPVDSR